MHVATVQELKRVGAGTWLALVGLTVRNWFAGWTIFLSGWLLDVATWFSAAAIFFLMGQLVAGGAQAQVAQYGVSYGAYIIVGVTFNMVMSTTLVAFHRALLTGYWANQLNTFLLYPGGTSAYLIGNLCAQYLLAGINTAIYLLVGVRLFGVPVVVSHLPDVLVILIVSVVVLAGLGLAGASTFSLLDAKQWGANPVDWLVGFGVTLLAGVYFPPTVLPTWLQHVGQWLPQTRALHAARLALTGNATLGSPAVVSDLRYMLIFGAISLPIGLLLYVAGMQKAQRDGTLTRWS